MRRHVGTPWPIECSRAARWRPSTAGLAVADDRELPDSLAAAYRVRIAWFGNRVHLNFLINAKSGHCGEDCGYCSQSADFAGRHPPP